MGHPQQLGEFQILRLVGKGGLGSVYRGWQPIMERPVALKCLPPAAAADSYVRDRFLREVRVLGRVRHPNLVQIYGAGTGQGTLFYAMEWIDGASLSVLQVRLKNLGCDPAELDLCAWHRTLADACNVFPPSNLNEMEGRPPFPRIADLLRQITSCSCTAQGGHRASRH